MESETLSVSYKRRELYVPFASYIIIQEKHRE